MDCVETAALLYVTTTKAQVLSALNHIEDDIKTQ